MVNLKPLPLTNELIVAGGGPEAGSSATTEPPTRNRAFVDSIGAAWALEASAKKANKPVKFRIDWRDFFMF